MIARLLRIHGKVQGVYYRDTAVSRAADIGVHGWVRNRHDGTVEALVAGEGVLVEAFIAWAHEGSTAARVDRVEIVVIDLPDELEGFERRPTA